MMQTAETQTKFPSTPTPAAAPNLVGTLVDTPPQIPRMILVQTVGEAAAAPMTPAPTQITIEQRIATSAKPVQAKEQAIAECVMPKGLKFKGVANFPCDVRIHGEVEGAINATHGRTVAVDATGRVKGEIKATNIRVDGTVDGALEAAGGLVSFGPKSVCTGHVAYGHLAIEEGADVEATMKKAPAKA